MLFKDAGCSGLTASFPADENPRNIAKYTMTDMEHLGMCNNCVTSVKLPYGYSVKLFPHDDWSDPDNYIVNGGMFLDATLSMPCVSLEGKFNDRTTSLWVYRNTSLGAANGYWTSITGSSDLTFEVSEGFTSTHREYTSTVNKYQLSYEMSEHIGFSFAGEESKISTSYSTEIKHDTEDMYSHEFTDKLSFSCERDPQDPDGGVGLWQWVVESSDGKSKTYTNHYVCRTGAGRYNKSPACPWNACTDGHCYYCESGWQD